MRALFWLISKRVVSILQWWFVACVSVSLCLFLCCFGSLSVCLFVCLFVCVSLSVCLFVCLFGWLVGWLVGCLSVCLVCLFVSLFVCLFTCLLLCLCVVCLFGWLLACLFVWLVWLGDWLFGLVLFCCVSFVCLFVRQWVCHSVRPSTRLSVYVWICLSACWVQDLALPFLGSWAVVLGAIDQNPAESETKRFTSQRTALNPKRLALLMTSLGFAGWLA